MNGRQCLIISDGLILEALSGMDEPISNMLLLGMNPGFSLLAHDSAWAQSREELPEKDEAEN
jgi:hypothetical protein